MKLKSIVEISQADINHIAGGVEEALNADGIVRLMDKYCPKPQPWQEFFTPKHTLYTIAASIGAGIMLTVCGIKTSSVIRRLLKVKNPIDIIMDETTNHIELGQSHHKAE